MFSLLLYLISCAEQAAQNLSALDLDADGDGANAELDCNDTQSSLSEPADLYVDGDGDGYGYGELQKVCAGQAGYVNNNSDCNDQSTVIYPNALEINDDGTDSNCDLCDDNLTLAYLDSDADGYGDPVTSSETVCLDTQPEYVTNNDDCNDDDSATNPDTLWYQDSDFDGFGNPYKTKNSCAQPEGYVAQGGDCDDTKLEINPTAIEVCDVTNVDEDCDGTSDDGDTSTDDSSKTTWYADADADNYGDPNTTSLTCEQPPSYVSDSSDCNDANSAFNPGASESCNDPNDYNCDGVTEYVNDDLDSFAACVECDDMNPAVNPSATEICNGMDDDCDGTSDEPDAADTLTWYADSDGDSYGDAATTALSCEQPTSYVSDSSDCNDIANSAFPGATEVCDGIDNDCDALSDEPDAVDAATWYADADGDGYGWWENFLQACYQLSGYVSDLSDCDDAVTEVNPSALEVCDTIDNNCDGITDDSTSVNASAWYTDADGDSFVNSLSVLACETPSGYREITEGEEFDCNDSTPSIYPGASEEECDGIDSDCWGELVCESNVGEVADVTWREEESVSWAGWSLASAGDQDGDGVGDVIIGAYTAGTTGRAYITSGAVRGENILSSSLAVLLGQTANDLAGYSVAGGIDLDSDGNPDVAVGAPYQSNDASFGGAVYVVSGPTTGTIDLSTANTRLIGLTDNSASGYSMLTDNGSLVIGAPYNSDAGFTYGGRIYAVETILTGTQNLESVSKVIFTGEKEGSRAGTALSSLDHNGDGTKDLVIGASFGDGVEEGLEDGSQGALYVVNDYWATSGTVSLGSADATLTQESSGDYLGQSHAVTGGDINNDGYEDLLAGAYGSNNGQGLVYAFLGPLTTSNLSEAYAKLSGNSEEDNAGHSVDFAGDTDGNGTPNILIGAPGVDGTAEDQGTVYVVPAFLVTAGGNISLAAGVQILNGQGESFGWTVKGMGDLDGNGINDFFVGAPKDETIAYLAGSTNGFFNLGW